MIYKIQATHRFIKAFDDFVRCTKETEEEANKELTLSVEDYRKAHKMSGACGLSDCMTHYNANYAKPEKTNY
jgi:hypothetical protein